MLAERQLHAAKIARRLVHVRLGDLDVIEADDRIDLDRMRLGALADNLTMDLAFRRHVDDEIAADPGLAAEPAAGAKRAALFGVAALDLAPWGCMIGARVNRMLGEIALGDIHLAAAAYAPSAADRIEIDAKFARDGEQARPVGEFAPFAGGREDDAMTAQRQTPKLWLVCAPRADRRPRLPRPQAPARDICGSRPRNSDRAP